MRQQLLISGFVCVISTTMVTAQVSVTGRESKDKSASTQQVTIDTLDRSLVPITSESKQTKVDAATTRTESTERARLNDGSYFNWRNTVTTKREIDSNRTETVQNVVENDRQGNARTTLQIRQEITRTPTGEQSQQSQYQRNNSGNMILDRIVSTTTTKNSDGSTSTTSTEAARDVNDNLRPVQQRQSTTVSLSPTKMQTTTQISQPDHLQGGFAVIARDTATVTTADNTRRTEQVLQQTDGGGWRDVGRVVTTETRSPDGSIQRETIEEGRSLYSQSAAPPMNVEPLAAQRRIVEREVHKPDGTVTLQRDVFRRDVNGDWRPVTFSTDTGGVGR